MSFRTTALVLAAFLTGCGGSAAPSDVAPQTRKPVQAAPPTRAEFVADARRVCARMGPRLERLGKPSSPPTKKQLLSLIDAWQVTLDDLHTVTPPAAEAKRFRTMLAHFAASARAAEEMPEAEGETALLAVAVMGDRGMKGATIAYAYGLEECSIFPPAPSQAEFERYVLTQAKKSGGLLHPRTRTDPPVGRLPARRDDR